jgi:Mrp family chromosome partitioning ATPase
MFDTEKTETLYTTLGENGEILVSQTPIGPDTVTRVVEPAVTYRKSPLASTQLKNDQPTGTSNGAVAVNSSMTNHQETTGNGSANSEPTVAAVSPTTEPAPDKERDSSLVSKQTQAPVIAQTLHGGQLAEPKSNPNSLVAPGALPVHIRLDPEWMEVTHLYAAMERYADGMFPTTTSDTLQAILGSAQAPAGTPKVLGISSAVKSEGKTTVAVQLAINVARNTYKKVALVDLSMRPGVLAKDLDLTGKGGIVPVLEGRDFRIPTLQMEGLDNLSLLPLGDIPKNPVKTAHSPALVEVMAAIREMFDLVIVDLPEVTSGYTLPLLHQTDGLLIVVASGVTPRRVVQAAIDMAGKQRVIGVILNRHKPAMPSWLRRTLEVF